MTAKDISVNGDGLKKSVLHTLSSYEALASGGQANHYKTYLRFSLETIEISFLIIHQDTIMVPKKILRTLWSNEQYAEKAGKPPRSAKAAAKVLKPEEERMCQ